jgi:TadE-like protein
MKLLTRLATNPRASVGAEFALITPILILFLLGIVDVGRMMWTWNRAEKAAQMGVRYAAVTDMADTGLADHDYYTTDGIARGTPITDFGLVTCTSAGCECTQDPCPGVGTFDTTAFDDTVGRMQIIMPEIQAENVKIEYSSSGLGYSGDPYGPDVNPLITIRLSDVKFQPILGYVFGLSITLPSFASTLTMEDGRWAISN